MVLNYNDTQDKNVVNNIVDGLKLNPITDAVPKTVVPTIQPTFEVKRRVCNIVRATTATNSSSVTVYTTPSDQDFYIVAGFLGIIKDATATTTFARLVVTIDGTQRQILIIPCLTLTPQENCMAISFPAPLKVDRNSTILLTASTTTGNYTINGGVTGYLEDAGNNLSV